jgi:hypothetical protein
MVLTIFPMIGMICITHASNKPSAKIGFTPICRDLQQLRNPIVKAQLEGEMYAIVEHPAKVVDMHEIFYRHEDATKESIAQPAPSSIFLHRF